METVQLARPSAAVAMAVALFATVTTATYVQLRVEHTKAVSGGLTFRPTPRQMAWATQHDRLAIWAKLPLDWDGEDGVAPSVQVLTAARAFITEAELAGLPSPEAYVAGDGEVGYVWETSRGFASMSLLSGGDLVGKIRSPDDPTHRINEAFAAVDLDDLFRRISRIA